MNEGIGKYWGRGIGHLGKGREVFVNSLLGPILLSNNESECEDWLIDHTVQHIVLSLLSHTPIFLSSCPSLPRIDKAFCSQSITWRRKSGLAGKSSIFFPSFHSILFHSSVPVSISIFQSILKYTLIAHLCFRNHRLSHTACHDKNWFSDTYSVSFVSLHSGTSSNLSNNRVNTTNNGFV